MRIEMMRKLQALACAGLVSLSAGTGLMAQAPKDEAGQKPATVPAASPAASGASMLVPLSVQVVLSRYQGEKKVSSLPYTLGMNANALRLGGTVSRLRMGTQIPVPMVAPPTVEGKPVGPTGGGPFQYRDVGTNIDAWANSYESNRYQVNISIEDSSVYTNEQAGSLSKVGEMPVFRSLRFTNELVLRDGQTAQFTAATDRVSGEVIKVDVTLTVVK
jgi:hypothetical protein